MLIRTVKNAAFKSGHRNWNREDDFMKVFGWGRQTVEEIEDERSDSDIEDLTIETLNGLGLATDKWYEDARKAAANEYRNQANCQFGTGVAAAIGAVLYVLAIVNLFTGIMPMPLELAYIIVGALAVAFVSVRFNELYKLSYEAGVWSARALQVEDLNRRLTAVQQDRERARANRASIVRFMRDGYPPKSTVAQPEPVKTVEPTVVTPPKSKIKDERLSIVWAKRPDAEEAQAWAMMYSRMTKEA